jgi:hypothetical protein
MRAATLFFLGMLTATPALASFSIGWIGTDEAEKLAAEMRDKHIRLIDIDCRQDRNATDQERTAFLMTWEDNDDNRDWSWREAATPAINDDKREFEAKGFKLVTEKSFTMASGKQRSCALWHKKAAEGSGPPAAPPHGN